MKNIILALIMVMTLGLVGLMPTQTAYAACATTGNTSKDKVIDGLGQTGNDCSGVGVTNFIRAIVNILSLIVGIAAVIVVILSGLRYITSAGDAGKVSSAKNTLVYALIGVAIAALAQFLIHYVFTASRASTFAACDKGTHRSADGKDCLNN